MTLRNLFVGLAAAASTLALGASANAATTLWTYSGSAAGGVAVDATALVTLWSGGLTIDLTDLLANPTSDGQELSGIQLTFSKAPTAATHLTASGTEINILSGASKGQPHATSTSDNVITHWGTAISGKSLYLATAGPGAAGGQPTDLIIGPGPYVNANASIIGKNAQILKSGLFGIHIDGFTPGEYLTQVSLSFGTGSSGDYHQSTCTDPQTGKACSTASTTVPVPEPATWAMMIMGVMGVGVMMRRRRAAAAAAVSVHAA